MDELTFEESNARLHEIADMVQDPAISLDEALTLYEEAVKLGLHACEVSEEGIFPATEEAVEADDVSTEAIVDEMTIETEVQDVSA